MAMEDTGDVVGQLLFLRHTEDLVEDVEGRGAGLDCEYGVAESRDCPFFVADPAGEPLSVQVKREVDAGEAEIEVVGIGRCGDRPEVAARMQWTPTASRL